MKSKEMIALDRAEALAQLQRAASQRTEASNTQDFLTCQMCLGK